jgi:hypothetical protein
MRCSWGLVVCLLARPASADEAALMQFMGGQGCTFGPQSIAAAEQAGYARADIDAAMTAHLADGTGDQQGDYVVVSESVCKIRLPDIQTDFPLNHPDILAVTSAIDAYAEDGSPGCFLADAGLWFESIGRPFDDYTRFLAAHIIAGDVRFYSTSPLRTPFSFHVISGACGNLAAVPAMRANHAKLVAGFEAFVRHQGALNDCVGQDVLAMDQAFAIELQGGDLTKSDAEVADINAWLSMEYLMIAMGAG